MVFSLLLVKPGSSNLTKSACQYFRMVVLLVSDHFDYYHMLNTTVLARG